MKLHNKYFKCFDLPGLISANSILADTNFSRVALNQDKSTDPLSPTEALTELFAVQVVHLPRVYAGTTRLLSHPSSHFVYRLMGVPISA
ncbi:hypothetical protein [Sphingobacterium faecium]|uniref:hypothetical protein n=1 Tax=Sphingobacterium faecium TaxID=34087 RepID=UPI00320967BE